MQAVIRVLLCFCLAFLLLHLLITGEISLYVNPRLKWLSAVSLLLLLLLGTVQLLHLKAKELHSMSAWGTAALFLPIAMYLLVPPGVLDAEMAQKKGLYNPALAQKQSRQAPSSQPGNGTPGSDAASGAASPQDVEIIQTEDPYKKMIPRFKSMPVIEPTEQTYGDILNTLHLYPEEFKGKKIRVTGFVYRDPTLKKNRFVVGRYSVACCVADATVVGFLTENDRGLPLKDGQWVEVTGTLDVTRLDEEAFPVIRLQKWRKVAALKDPYIYFNY